jgi:uncharacterized membrane protein
MFPRFSRFHFFPLALPFFIILFVAVVFLISAIEIGVVGYAYEKIGINPRYVFAVLLLSLLGSYINIPVSCLPSRENVSKQEITVFGVRYVIPTAENRPGTVVAINLGGAVIPTAVSLYLIVRYRLFLQGFLGIVIVGAVAHAMAKPVRGLGIAVPVFIPPLAAALTALLLSSERGPQVAYIAGTLGTLIGADLLNLGRIQGLGAPIVSIGGAGTFDGIFLTGILAVLLA